jgi:tRNA nucleotidyltransferase (CCA-adding enzyme)
LSKDVQQQLRLIGAEADKAGVRAFLVGGMVRDLLLRQSGGDIDVVVEGDAVAFARRLESVLKAKALIHEKFRTAALTLKDGSVLDVVTARRETYPAPGALPVIVPAKLKDDLLRRDFTMNALALSLNDEDLGVLCDDAKGFVDIEAKLIRIMHDKSLIDDPTRILRAARYAARFGFHLAALTQDALDEALAADVFKTLTPTRYFLELRRILDEKEPVPAMDTLAVWGAVRYVPYEAEDRMRLMAAGQGWEARLGALLKELPVAKAHEIMALFCISKSAQKRIL